MGKIAHKPLYSFWIIARRESRVSSGRLRYRLELGACVEHIQLFPLTKKKKRRFIQLFPWNGKRGGQWSRRECVCVSTHVCTYMCVCPVWLLPFLTCGSRGTVSFPMVMLPFWMKINPWFNRIDLPSWAWLVINVKASFSGWRRGSPCSDCRFGQGNSLPLPPGLALGYSSLREMLSQMGRETPHRASVSALAKGQWQTRPF